MKKLIIILLLATSCASVKVEPTPVKPKQKGSSITKQDARIVFVVFLVGYVLGDHFKEEVKTWFDK